MFVCIDFTTLEKIKRLSKVVEVTPIGAILLAVEENYIDEFYVKYLHDFVRIIHPCLENYSNFKERQYEVGYYVMANWFIYILVCNS